MTKFEGQPGNPRECKTDGQDVCKVHNRSDPPTNAAHKRNRLSRISKPQIIARLPCGEAARIAGGGAAYRTPRRADADGDARASRRAGRSPPEGQSSRGTASVRALRTPPKPPRTPLWTVLNKKIACRTEHSEHLRLDQGHHQIGKEQNHHDQQNHKHHEDLVMARVLS